MRSFDGHPVTSPNNLQASVFTFGGGAITPQSNSLLLLNGSNDRNEAMQKYQEVVEQQDWRPGTIVETNQELASTTSLNSSSQCKSPSKVENKQYESSKVSSTKEAVV